MVELQMKKCHLLIVSLILLIVFLSSCGAKESGIEGYWISGDGKYSVSFDDEKTVVVDGKYIGEYKIYKQGNIAINVDTATFDEVLDIVMSAEYSINDGILTIKNLDTSETYTFYTEEKAAQYINSDYVEKFSEYTGNKKDLLYQSIGYYDEKGDLIKEYDWYLENSDITLEEMRSNAEKTFNEEILSLYKRKSPDAKYVVDSSNLIVIDNVIMNVYELRREGLDTLSLVNRYAIRGKDGTIYIHNVVQDTYELWNGTILDGKSLFMY